MAIFTGGFMKFLYLVVLFSFSLSIAGETTKAKFAPQNEQWVPKGCYPVFKDLLKLLRLIVLHR
jgi:hypothetical protein